MFVDSVRLTLNAGAGGNGVVAWRREKYIPKGGPYGGNGGKGGSIVFEGDENLFSLESFRNRRLLRAQNGKCGGPNLRQGGSGESLVVKIPFGTLIKDAESKEVLFDCTPETPRYTACTGGKGGLGNAFFRSPTHQAPNFATPGADGQALAVELELKLIADVGLVGMPNAGKSTIHSRITNASVKIAPYPFTTLSPNLSYIQFEDYTRILIADIPGIIEDAHANRGLGLSFLKHVERTSALVFVIDISGEEGRNPYEDFLLLRKEVETYRADLLDKPFIVVLNKMDKENAQENLEEFRAKYTLDPATLIPISALHEEGLTQLVDSMRGLCLSLAR